MPRLFQIYEDDLETLEQVIPKVADPFNMKHYDNAMRARIRRLQRILSDVRWNYGPPGAIEEIPAGDEPPQPTPQ
ncbi:MAG TPA: hypothetical protein VD994_12840 [Prosthecobacter sp.]|nr:hypothetical protein [Prosthecobacter sp.]